MYTYTHIIIYNNMYYKQVYIEKKSIPMNAL